MTTDRAAIYAALKLKAAPAKATADVAWNKAIRTHWVKLSAEERAAGWPDAFTPENLARLQHPYEGIDSEKKRAKRDHDALLGGLRASIEAGILPALERSRMEDVTEWRNIPNWNAPRHSWDRDGQWPPTVNQPVKIGERAVTFFVIERAAFREFLAAQGIEPSEHIRAWLRPLEQADAASAAAVAKRGRKPSDAPALLARILAALEIYAAETGQDFDRNAMPGPLGESADEEGSFHWLCARLYPGTFNRAKSTFAGHRAGLCAVAPYAKPTDFYRQALPRIAPKLGVALNVHHMPKPGRKFA